MKSLVMCFCFLIFMQKFANTQNSYSWLLPCETDKDCEELQDGKCSNGICSCGQFEDYVCEPVKTSMVTKIGLNCEDSTNCKIQNAECTKEKKCLCVKGTISSENGKKCLNISQGPGDSCEESVQCKTQNALTLCESNKCVCERGMHEHNGQCFTSIELGGTCLKDEECSHIEFSKCTNFKCSCMEQYVASTSKCLSIVQNLNSLCLENVQCTATLGTGSLCSEGKCQCKDLYHFKQNNTKCVRGLVFGDTCEKHSDCHQPGSGRSRLECVLGVCKCKSTFFEENGYCISSAIRLQAFLLNVISIYLLSRIVC